MARRAANRRVVMSARAARCEQIFASVPDVIWFLAGYLIIAVAMEATVYALVPVEGETHPWAWLGFTNVRTDIIQQGECPTMDVKIIQKLHWSPRVWKYIRSMWLFDIFSGLPLESDVCGCAYFLLYMDPRGFARRNAPGYNTHAEYEAPNDIVMTIVEYSTPMKYSTEQHHHNQRPKCFVPWTFSSVEYTRRNGGFKQKMDNILFSATSK